MLHYSMERQDINFFCLFFFTFSTFLRGGVRWSHSFLILHMIKAITMPWKKASNSKQGHLPSAHYVPGPVLSVNTL